jgi:integrase/recombinase XerD
MMNDYYQQSMRALQLAGMSKRTQECYTRSVRMLVDFYGKAPELISELQLQDYFLHRKNVDQWSAATMRICYAYSKTTGFSPSPPPGLLSETKFTPQSY